MRSVTWLVPVLAAAATLVVVVAVTLFVQNRDEGAPAADSTRPTTAGSPSPSPTPSTDGLLTSADGTLTYSSAESGNEYEEDLRVTISCEPQCTLEAEYLSGVKVLSGTYSLDGALPGPLTFTTEPSGNPCKLTGRPGMSWTWEVTPDTLSGTVHADSNLGFKCDNGVVGVLGFDGVFKQK